MELCRYLMLPFLLLTFMITTGFFGPSPDESWQKAQQLATENQCSQAIVHLRNVLQENSQRKDALLLAGQCELTLGHLSLAYQYLDKARQQKAQNWQLPMARLLLASGQYDKLVNQLTIDKNMPADQQASLLALGAAAYLHLDRTADAQRLIKLSLQRDKNNADGLWAKASLAFSQNKRSVLEMALQKLNFLHPQYEQGWLLRGDQQNRLGAYSQAVAAYRKAIQINNHSLAARYGEVISLIAQREWQPAMQRTRAFNQPYPPLVYLLRAQIYLGMDQPEQARSAIQQLLKKNQLNSQAQLLSADIHYRLGEYEQARQVLSTFLSRPQDKSLAHKARVLQVRIDLAQKQPHRAEETLAALRKDRPQNPGLQILHGETLLQLGNREQALLAFQKAIELSPYRLATPLTVAKILTKNNQRPDIIWPFIQRAALLTEQMSKTRQQFYRHPLLHSVADHLRHPLTRVNTGIQLERMRSTLIEQLKILIRDSNSYHPFQLLLVQQYLRDAKPQQALEFIAQLPEAQQQDDNIRLLQAEAYRLNNQQDQAIQLYKMLIAQSPNWPAPWLASILLHQQQQQWPQAFAALNAMKKALPDQGSMIETIKAGLYQRQNKPEQALQQWQKIFAEHPSESHLLNIAQLYGQLQQPKKAVILLNQWLAKHPKSVDSLTLLAKYHTLLNQRGQAIKALERLKKVAPDNIVILNDLAWQYYQQGDERALALARKAYEKAPDNPFVLDTLGTILLAKQQASEAVMLLSLSFQQRPNSLTSGYRLAKAYHQTNQNDRALSLLHQLLESNKPFPERNQAVALSTQLEKFL